MRQSPAPAASAAGGALPLRSSRQRELTKPRAHHDGLLVRPGWTGPLRRPLLPGRPRVDAVVVPAGRAYARSADVLDRLAAFAARVGAVLVVVASRDADAALLAGVAPLRHPHVAVLDLSDAAEPAWRGLLPDLVVDRHPLGLASLPDEWDTSVKRNVALALGTVLGWRTVLFLDDDIVLRRGAPVPLRRLAVGCALVERGAVAAAGFISTDFPDNSVVCHARRVARMPQGVFLGAGALLVAVDDRTPFFPRIYNEDWLFQYPLLRDAPGDPGRIAVLGEVQQRPYEPFRRERAQREELGDVLAEGLYQLKDGAAAGRAPRRDDMEDPGFWKDVLAERAAMIAAVRERLVVTDADRSAAGRQKTWARHAKRLLRGALQRPVRPLWRAYQTAHRAGVRDRARAALVVSLQQHDLRPGDVALADALGSWVTAWQADLRTWREHEVPADLARALLTDPGTTPWLGADVLGRARSRGLVTSAAV